MPAAPMQLGISTWVWTSPATTAVLETLLPHIAELGFDVIELPIEEVGQFDVKRAGELAREHGLEVSVCAVIGPGRDLLLPGEAGPWGAVSPVVHRRGSSSSAPRPWPARFIRPLGAVGGPLPPSGSATSTRSPAFCARGWLRGDHGVVLGVETLNRFETASEHDRPRRSSSSVPRGPLPPSAWHSTYSTSGSRRSTWAMPFARGAGTSCISRSPRTTGAPRGPAPFPGTDVAKALDEIGYRGRIVIETFSDRVEAIARAAAIWRPLAPDSDSLASEGLAFLRTLLAQQPTSAVH
jgi:D-psicose/D-tagatose/L-ribulose 3-epimerase